MNKTEYTVAQELTSTIQAIHNCGESGNLEWREKHTETVEWLRDQFLPHGSGIDNGCEIDLDASTAGKLVIHTSYHHMNDDGMYDGWTEHDVIVRPSFVGLDVRVTGRDRNGIKDYLADCFRDALAEICHVIDHDANRNEHGHYFHGEWHKREV